VTDTVIEQNAEEARALPAVRASEAIVARGEVSVEEVVAQRDKIEQVMNAVMREGVHYGKIPGVQKPTLLKPGAEVLATTFRFAPHYQSERTFHDGGHLTVVTKVTLQHIPTGLVVAEGEGLCTTYEKKYAYRGDGRVCPACGAGTIRKSKFPPRETDYPGASKDDPPGWYCHGASGGCGANFAANDPEIVDQQSGRVDNPDLPDTWNTVLKMANKRALIAAILNGTAASDIFTQDVEDAAPTGAGRSQPQPRQASYRDEHPDYTWPDTWQEITDRLGARVGDEEAAEWLREAIHAMFTKLPEAMTTEERRKAFVVCSRALYEVEGASGDLAFDPNVRGFMQEVFAKLLDGAVLEGPPWAVSPTETDRLTKGEHMAEADGAPPEADGSAEDEDDIPFGEASSDEVSFGQVDEAEGGAE
jgi:hypothetical protein